jgi:peptidoglycan/xylan/chitin deacetylase (PgdA/CDA1 family)
MIGVIAKPGQVESVEEFFQLFKTPWEIWRANRSYDVVIASTVEVPDISTRLLIVCGAEAKTSDPRFEIATSSVFPRATLDHRGSKLPIYQGTVTFIAESGSSLCTIEEERIAGIRLHKPGMTVLRLGYDLFQEVEYLLQTGQPPEWAATASIDAHARLLRTWILEEGIPFVEVPPSPSGHSFSVCLTHDIDFIGIKQHKLDHTMWGFLVRATLGSLSRLVKGEISLGQCLQGWRAVLSVPFVYVGWARDFWLPFEWYLNADKGLGTTYFLIPFKGRPGENVESKHADRRAAAYDILDIAEWTTALLRSGCEIGVHGIDSWHSTEEARKEIARTRSVTGQNKIGVRMHWLLESERTAEILEEAGYSYDSTTGYNETVGYRCGTSQVFRPIGAKDLLELPVLIQDGALFYPGRLSLAKSEAWERCHRLIRDACENGGVLTLIWHDRSPHPERFWGEFYLRLVDQLKSQGAWFGTASQVVGWYRERRAVVFSLPETPPGAVKIKLNHRGGKITPPLRIRVHRPGHAFHGHESRKVENRTAVDLEWTGESNIEIDLAGSPTSSEGSSREENLRTPTEFL